MNFIQVVTTTALREEAERIARELVEARLAACAQVVGPIASTYRWQGKIETAEEWQCWVKTEASCSPASKRPFAARILTKCPRFWPCRWLPAAPRI